MSWPFDDGSALPVRDGFDVGGGQERTMGFSVGGFSGQRVAEEVNPDGSITILRTRLGNPIFETTAAVRGPQASTPSRGFVAKASSRAVLFDPYTLDILDANYQPAVNTYSVQDFATSWNVPAADDTDWYDVVLFDGSTIKVNAKAMPTLGITANHGYPAIPYVINRETAEDQYGNAERNTTEKRVFAVGRYSVTSWGGGGVTETLTPTAPRTEDRAMTIGQRVDHATNKAWLGQLYHPAAGWDAAGEWYFTSAEVTMLLASAYLVKVAGNANVAMSPPPLSHAGDSSGYLTTAKTFPPTPTGMYTTNRVESVGGYPSGGLRRTVQYGWAGVVTNSLSGQINAAYTRTEYSGSSSSSEVSAGRVLNYSASNHKQWDNRNQRSEILPQTIPYPSNPGWVSEEWLHAGPPMYWESGNEPGSIGSTRGKTERILPYVQVIFDSEVDAQYEDQDGLFSVKLGEISLVEGSYSRGKESGDQALLTPNTTYYDTFLANPYGLIGTGSGMGIYSQTHIRLYALFPNDLEPGAVNAKIDAMVAAYQGQTCYDDESTSGSVVRPEGYFAFYWRTRVPLSEDTSTMSWSSKDFLLYDETNGVYISVEGSFVGVDTAATLTVILKVQTRHHTVTQTLGEYSYTYSQLVQEREIGDTGKYAMPSPQIRAIFAPLYQEQGSFKGAHYVTQEEEGNGSAPAHLFNFLLYLDPYGSIGTINDDNLSSSAVHFVPCNLLEMLYAFVFSQEYGVSEDGQRYPVTFASRYSDMMGTLFSTPVRVSVRDGVQGNWSDALGPDFASISTVSLHRT
jgi:hypothetical protein